MEKKSVPVETAYCDCKLPTFLASTGYSPLSTKNLLLNYSAFITIGILKTVETGIPRLLAG